MYEWAVNPTKVARAIQVLKAEKKEVTEESVKALYIQYGGAIQDAPIVAEEADEEKPVRRAAKK
jgi:hypothetical protein